METASRMTAQPPLPRTLSAFFWHFIRKQLGGFSILAVSFLAWPIFDMVMPYLLNQMLMVLHSFENDKHEAIRRIEPYCLILLALFIFNEMMFRAHDWMLAIVIPKFRAQVTTAMFTYASGHSHHYFSEHFAGAVANRVNKMAASLAALVYDFVQCFIPTAFVVLLGTGFVAAIDPLFGYIFGLWFLLYTVGIVYTSRTEERYSEAHSAKVTALNATTVDILTNIATVRLFSRQRYEYKKFAEAQTEEQNAAVYLMKYVFRLKLLFGASSAIVSIIWWALAIYFWMLGRITIGDLTQLIMQLWALIGFAWMMAPHFLAFFEETGICREALGLVNAGYDVADAPGAAPLQVTKGEIIFDNVHFHYIPGRDIFKDKNITIEAGQKVGLVGFSGSGKSTFANLILRLYDVEDGRILIDGQDINSVTQDSLRESISMIPQDTTLFHRSLMDNIRYGKPDATDEEVIAASKQAHCDEFISQIDDGYNALVGDRGVKLSGGQRQRIAIARAFLKNAPILILDEATSALDSITEKYIQQGLDILMRNRTTIIIAHRLSTLAHLDRILVFKSGEIIEDGSHSQLIAENGHYATLWNMQAGGFLPDADELTEAVA